MPTVTAARTADLLRASRYSAVHELGWGDRVQAGAAEIRAFEVNHWGARMRTDTYRGFNGYTIEAGGHSILFGGDTAATTAFRSLRTSRSFDLDNFTGRLTNDHIEADYVWHDLDKDQLNRQACVFERFTPLGI